MELEMLIIARLKEAAKNGEKAATDRKLVLSRQYVGMVDGLVCALTILGYHVESELKYKNGCLYPEIVTCEKTEGIK